VWRITRCAKGIVNEAGGFKWRFKRDLS